jgi:hypothetical protein
MKVLTVSAWLAAGVVACGGAPADQPIEAGTVRWQRDLDRALEQSAETGKPVFVLFQEIPGCAGCQAFGKDVLSYPLLVEAIEDEFIPVLVYNNRQGGEDEKLLKRFREPAWNYQVVRFLDAEGRDILPRKDRVWSLGGIASRMVEALAKEKRTVPKYLKAVADENDTENQGVAAFAMPCFWTGERELGGIEGVVSTEAGWMGHREVTRVVYRKNVLSPDALAEKAAQVQCADQVYTSQQVNARYRKARASDQKKQIARSKVVAKLPGLTAMQQTKLNAFAGADRAEALSWLSPRQREALK